MKKILILTILLVSCEENSSLEKRVSNLESVVYDKTTIPISESQPTLAWWSPLLTEAIKFGFFGLTSVLTLLIGILAKKFHFEKHSRLLEDIVRESVQFAEQWALSETKNGSPKISGYEKVKKATEIIRILEKKHRLKEQTEEFWRVKMESWLARDKV